MNKVKLDPKKENKLELEPKKELKSKQRSLLKSNRKNQLMINQNLKRMTLKVVQQILLLQMIVIDIFFINYFKKKVYEEITIRNQNRVFLLFNKEGNS